MVQVLGVYEFGSQFENNYFYNQPEKFQMTTNTMTLSLISNQEKEFLQNRIENMMHDSFDTIIDNQISNFLRNNLQLEQYQNEKNDDLELIICDRLMQIVNESDQKIKFYQKKQQQRKLTQQSLKGIIQKQRENFKQMKLKMQQKMFQIDELTFTIESLQKLVEENFNKQDQSLLEMMQLQQSLLIKNRENQMLFILKNQNKTQIRSANEVIACQKEEIKNLIRNQQTLKKIYESQVINLKQSHYKTIVQMQQSRTKLQKKIQEMQNKTLVLNEINQNQAKSIQYHLKSIESLNQTILTESLSKQQQEKINNDLRQNITTNSQNLLDLQRKISKIQSQKTILEAQFSEKTQQFVKIYKDKRQLEIQILTLRQTIEALTKTAHSQAPDLLNQFIVKNNEFSIQIAKLLAEIEEIKRQNLQQNQNHQAEKQSIKQSLSYSEEKIKAYLVQIQQLKTSKRVENDQKQTQTVQQQRRTSGIRKQILSKKSSLRSHSLLSDDSKQNINKSNKPVIQTKSCKQSCKHILKIASLNQIINFMLNHIKGFEKDGIRSNSWFQNQIMKQGQSYRLKLLQLKSIQTKNNILQSVHQLCLQDQNCRALIKDFQTVMAFYFNKGKSNGCESFNRTVNKYRNVTNDNSTLQSFYE